MGPGAPHPVAEGETVALEPAADGTPASVMPLREVIAAAARRRVVLVRGREGASGSATRIVAGKEELASVLSWAAARQEATHSSTGSTRSGRARTSSCSWRPKARALRRRHRPGPGREPAPRRQPLPVQRSARRRDDRHAEALGRHLRGMGYTGLGGAHFCEYPDPATGEPRLFFAELNARINGASYPVVAAGRPAASRERPMAFLSGYVKTTACSFAELGEPPRQPPGLRPRGGPGTLPYNTGCLEYGYCSALVLDETPEAVQRRWSEAAAAAAEAAPGLTSALSVGRSRSRRRRRCSAGRPASTPLNSSKVLISLDGSVRSSHRNHGAVSRPRTSRRSPAAVTAPARHAWSKTSRAGRGGRSAPTAYPGAAGVSPSATWTASRGRCRPQATANPRSPAAAGSPRSPWRGRLARRS